MFTQEWWYVVASILPNIWVAYTGIKCGSWLIDCKATARTSHDGSLKDICGTNFARDFLVNTPPKLRALYTAAPSKGLQK